VPITVLLAEDDALVCSGLRELLRIRAGFQVVGEALDGLAAVELAEAHRPDVVVMDIGLPKLDGLTATSRIARACPGVRVVVLSGLLDEATVERARRVGATAVISKERVFEDLIEALESAAGGRA
jgi:DNA-binding NarL/FixJ family response regulator